MQVIPHIVLGSGSPRLLITAGVHGDEFEPMAAVRRLAGLWQEQPLRGRVTLVPCVNQAAFRRGSRTADDQLDLARICPGRDDGSVTERMAAALARMIRDADYYVDLHTAGALYQILPLAGYTLHAEASVLEVQRRMAFAFELPTVWGTSARNEGRSLSVARDARVPAIYVECGGGSYQPQAVERIVSGCQCVARLLGVVDGAVVPRMPEYWVEDDRDESGHLQAQVCAPCDGFFMPGVSLGQVVAVGGVLGAVVDVLGEVERNVVANRAGRVLFLRTFNSVAVGDPLAAILPITAPGHVSFPRGG